MGLSDSPGGPACSSRTSGWSCDHRLGSPVLRALSLCQHAVAITPVGSRVRVSRSLKEPVTAAFPIPLLGRLPHFPFRGLLGVHSRYGLLVRGIAKRSFPSEASAVKLPRLPLRLLPAGTTVAGQELHLLKNDALSRRTKGAGVEYYVVMFRIIDSRPLFRSHQSIGSNSAKSRLSLSRTDDSSRKGPCWNRLT
jgi:hypothetical protein